MGLASLMHICVGFVGQTSENPDSSYVVGHFCMTNGATTILSVPDVICIDFNGFEFLVDFLMF